MRQLRGTKKAPGKPGALKSKQCFLLVARNSQEAVAWVFLNVVTARQVSSLWALVLREVKDPLFFAAAKRNIL
jgi:hypothetical protein